MYLRDVASGMFVGYIDNHLACASMGGYTLVPSIQQSADACFIFPRRTVSPGDVRETRAFAGREWRREEGGKRTATALLAALLSAAHFCGCGSGQRALG